MPQHVLRHWEEVFGQIRPMRRAGGRRYYRPADIDVLRGVRVLLYDERYTTKGVQKIFKENGVKYIAELGRLAAAGQSVALRAPLIDEDAEDRLPAETEVSAPADAPSQSSDSGGETHLSPALRERLSSLLSRLEKAQDTLDEALLAIEAIEAEAVEEDEENG